MPELTTDRALLQELHALLREGEEEALEIFLRLVRPEDIAEWFDLLSADDRQKIVSALDHESAGTVLTDTTAFDPRGTGRRNRTRTPRAYC